MPTAPTRRRLMTAALGMAAALAEGSKARAAMPFGQWVEQFRARALAKGISNETYTRELSEETWQYLNRRVSDWRIITGKERAREQAALFDRLERDYGVDRYILLGL